ncbi:MAG: hypothetical protein HQ567_20870, partial [Candidatus Nealsonbacteria bacterium]|nr:hypothetical protein [Candidatus Nealsonbacteria bacterium]
MNKFTLVTTLGLVAVLMLGSALSNPSSADVIVVPNGGFELIYKPGTDITGDISGGGWTQGVGPDCPIDSGNYLFDDGSTGEVADIPGWIGADRDGWINIGDVGY